MLKKSILIFFFISIAILSNTTNAQENVNSGTGFYKDRSNVCIGYGFPYLTASIAKVLTNNNNDNNISTISIGPIYAKYEYAVTDHIGVGINLAYASTTLYNSYQLIGSTFIEKVNQMTISGLLRLNYHILSHQKFDPYIGAGLGYRFVRNEYYSNEPFIDELILDYPFFPLGGDFTLGARYFLTDNFGIYAEAGLAKSPVQIGLSLAF